MNNTTPIDPSDVKKLRDANLIAADEAVFRMGDLVIAENISTKARRVIDASSLLLESSKRLLKG